MKILGIDYGTKRIGMAISDENSKLAFPKEIILNDGKAIEKITEILRTEDIKEIVVGESLDFAGKPNKVSTEIDKFISTLLSRFNLDVHKEKEFLTSVEARRYDKESRADARAAALILQRYLDKRNQITASRS